MSRSIAFLNPTYWPEVARGSERFIDDLARGLREAGDETRLITSHPERADASDERGLAVQRVKRPRGEGRLRRLGFDDFWTHVPLTYRAIGDPDLVHACYPTDGVAAGLWSRRTGRPAVLTLTGIPNPHLRVKLDAVPRAARLCAVTTALSKWAAEGFWWRYGVEARVTYPAVDQSAFAPGDRAPVPTIFCAATPDVARKRVPLLVEAFGLVRRERPDAELVLIRPTSPALAAELAAVEGVSLVDPGSDPGAMAALYRTAWVHALPSIGEAFGIVLIEALASGTPNVGTDAGAFGEIIDSDGVGRLFDGGADELARALLEALALAEDPATAERCRASAARFTLDRLVRDVRAIHDEVLT